jgi:hypothetical protein
LRLIIGGICHEDWVDYDIALEDVELEDGRGRITRERCRASLTAVLERISEREDPGVHKIVAEEPDLFG